MASWITVLRAVLVDPEAGQFIDPVTSSKSIGSLPATGIVVGSNDIIILSSLFVDKYSFQYTKYYIYQRMYVNIYSTFSFSSTNEQSANISNIDRKSTRLNSSHSSISYAVFCLK